MNPLYRFGEHMRWSWPFDSPNNLGALLAMVLPGLWALHNAVGDRKTMSGLIKCCELGILFALCMTYSRGALVSVMATASAYGFYLCKRNFFGFKLTAIIRAIWWRLAALLLFILLTGFGGRVAVGYVVSDLSVVHRVEIWRVALAMISASPWSGWDYDMGADHYLHWFQPLTESVVPGSLVNSYLQVAVDLGLGSFILVVATVTIVVMLPLTSRAGVEPRRTELFFCAAGAALVGFFVGNIFSILGVCWQLDVIAVVLAGLCTADYWMRKLPEMKLVVGVTIGVPLTFAVGLLFGSRIIAATLPVQIRRIDNASVQLRRTDATEPSRLVYVYPDSLVLGTYYGRCIRELVQAAPPNWAIIVRFGELKAPPPKGSNSLLVGRAIGSVRCVPSTWVLLHPLFRAPHEVQFEGGLVIVPEIDEFGQAEWLRRLASMGQFHLQVNPGVGQDCRSAWSEITSTIINEIEHAPIR